MANCVGTRGGGCDLFPKNLSVSPSFVSPRLAFCSFPLYFCCCFLATLHARFHSGLPPSSLSFNSSLLFPLSLIMFKPGALLHTLITSTGWNKTTGVYQCLYCATALPVIPQGKKNIKNHKSQVGFITYVCKHLSYLFFFWPSNLFTHEFFFFFFWEMIDIYLQCAATSEHPQICNRHIFTTVISILYISSIILTKDGHDGKKIIVRCWRKKKIVLKSLNVAQPAEYTRELQKSI